MKTRIALVLVSASLLCVGARSSTAAILYQDNYTTNTSANYTTTDQGGATSTWNVNVGTPGNVTYTRDTGGGYNSSVFLLNPSVASTAGLYQYEVSGIIANPGGGGNQPGLVLSASTTAGGYVIQTNDGAGVGGSPFTLERETAGQLLGDEGGSSNPPVLAIFGSPSQAGFSNTDTYQISALVSRSGAHDTFDVSILDLTNDKYLVENDLVTNSGDPAGYGGDQIGWRSRASIGAGATAGFSLTALTLSTVPEPSSIVAIVGLCGMGLIGLICYRRRAATKHGG